MKRVLSMLGAYLKIGCIGFGGGSALIPVIEKELVAERKLVSPEKYKNHVIVANITPGTLPVKLAAAGGFSVGGSLGMILAAMMVSLPGVAGTILLLSVLSRMGAGALHQIEYMAVGIGVFILFLLVSYIGRVIQGRTKPKEKGLSVVIMLLVFVLTAGKELRQLFGIGGTPLIDLSTVEVLMMVFFMIFYTCGIFTPGKLVISGTLLLLFLLCTAQAHPILEPCVLYTVEAAMLALSIKGILISMKSNGARREGAAPMELMRKLRIWGLAMVLTSLPALLVVPGAVGYLADGFVSTVVSFGGGEAYLTVADSMFVASGIISSEAFYSQLLPIANALPGPILSKLLAGVGYYFGYAAGGTALAGWLLAVAGYGVSLAATCCVFFLVAYIYQRYESLPAFQLLKAWILPVICGLLLTTMAAMLYEILGIITGVGWPVYVGALCIAGLYLLIYGLHRTLHLNDLLQILLSGGASLLVLNFLVF